MRFGGWALTALMVLGVGAAAQAQTPNAASDVPALTARVRAAPSDVDSRLKLGLALSQARQWSAAEREFRQVIAQAPDYWDAHIAYARIAYWRGDLAEAQRRLAPVQAASTPPATAVEAQALSSDIAAARREGAHGWRLDVTGSYSDLNRGLGPWKEATASLSHPVSADGKGYVAGTVQATERFDRRDVFLEGLYGRTVMGTGEAYVAVGGTPNADFRPQVQVRAGITAPLNGRGLSGGLHATLAKFPTEETAGLRGMLRQSFLEDRLAISGSIIQVWTDNGRSLTGYAVQGEAAVTERLRLLLGWSDAPESSDGIAIDVKAVTAGLRYDIDERRAIGLTYAHEDRGAYKRNEVALSTTLRF